MAVLGYEVRGWGEGLAVGHGVAVVAAAYCYWVVRRLPEGLARVVSCAPVFVAFAYLPLVFNRETHLVGIAMFYCILTWMATFKVLLLCWGTGPGYDPWVATCFPRFAVVMTYPAHMKRAGKLVKKVPGSYPSWLDRVTKSEAWYMLLLRSALKLVALVILLHVLLLQRESYPKILTHLLFSIQLYLFVTIVLELLAAFANTVFGITIEPHFDNPFAAVSLEEFWARRWNLLVSNALRETVFNPVLYLLQKLQTQVRVKRSKSQDLTESLSNGPALPHESKDGQRGLDLPKLVAMLAAFLVSGLAHELSVYYVTLHVTWEMNSFFVVQGVAVALEAAWKIYVPGIKPTRVVGKLLTLGFAFITSHWLFWPPIDGVSDQVLLEMKRMLLLPSW